MLPVMKFRDVSEVVAFVRAGEKPLALYIFSKSRAFVDKFMEQVQSGQAALRKNNLKDAPHV